MKGKSNNFDYGINNLGRGITTLCTFKVSNNISHYFGCVYIMYKKDEPFFFSFWVCLHFVFARNFLPFSFSFL